jgi:hypothetical protein
MSNSNIGVSITMHDEYACIKCGDRKTYKANLTRVNGMKKYSRKSFTRAREAVEYARMVASHSSRNQLRCKRGGAR